MMKLSDGVKEGLKTWLSAFVCALAFGGAAHSSSQEPSTRTTPVIASDGFSAFLISCPASREACFKALGAACPDGYRDVPPATSAEKLFETDHLIRCNPRKSP